MWVEQDDFGRLVANPEIATPLVIILCDQAAPFRESTASCTWRRSVEGVRLSEAVLHYASWLAAIIGHLQSGRRNMATKPRMQNFNDACWNVMAMFNKANSCHPVCRSALITHMNSHLNIAISAFIGARFVDEDCLKAHGFTLLWSEKPSTD